MYALLCRIANGCESAELMTYANCTAYRIGDHVFTLNALQDLYNDKVEYAKSMVYL